MIQENSQEILGYKLVVRIELCPGPVQNEVIVRTEAKLVRDIHIYIKRVHIKFISLHAKLQNAVSSIGFN